MCGIYAKLYTTNQSSSKVEVQRMMQESIYRGPDSQEICQIDNHTFGFNRLAIIDLDDRSNQPMVIDEIGKLIVFNGEIYNYLEIKQQLLELGYHFKTESDTEVALLAYHHFGPDAFNLFNGMWAMCIYDLNSKKIILSRDRFGVKPLYYMFQDGSFYFASEIKSLRKVKSEIKIDKESEEEYLFFGRNKFTNNRTLVEGILEHPAGHFSEVSHEKIFFSRYFQIPKERKDLKINEVIKNVQETFKDALKLRLRSDVPIALLLSGGLDSSAIAYQINQMIEDGEIELNKIHAFTLNFPGFEMNEWYLVQKNAHLLPHIICESIDIDLEEFKVKLPELMKIQDVPTFSVSHLIHLEALREIKAKGFTVVLNGQGADEVYGGYFPKDIGYFLLDYLKKNPSALHKQMVNLRTRWLYSVPLQLGEICKAKISQNPLIFAMTKTKRVKKILNYKRHIMNVRREYGISSNTSFRSKMQVFDTQFNGILQYEDMTSMLNSIEMRSPFLDYRIVELGLSLPMNLKMADGQSKYLLRKAFQNIVPNSIYNAFWKLGYAVPKKVILPSGPRTNSEKIQNYYWRTINLQNIKSNL
jgi:asparagine synthase (glutamine-hydrolysing)